MPDILVCIVCGKTRPADILTYGWCSKKFELIYAKKKAIRKNAKIANKIFEKIKKRKGEGFSENA